MTVWHGLSCAVFRCDSSEAGGAHETQGHEHQNAKPSHQEAVTHTPHLRFHKKTAFGFTHPAQKIKNRISIISFLLVVEDTQK